MRVRWREFELPSEVVVDEETRTDQYARFIIEPFERGFGVTVGNSLRRVLLSSLEGAAIYAVKVEGVPHEFTALPGVYEDMVDICLRLKQIRVKIYEGEEVQLRLERHKRGQVTAGDIECPANAEILNKDLVICNLTEDVDFVATLWARKGRGYVTAEEFARGEQEIGVIYLDASFSPVARVRYKTEETRVGQRTNYDRLILEIWTNGVVTPDMALVEAAKILRKHLNPFVQFNALGHERQTPALEEKPQEMLPSTIDEELLEKLSRPISELNLKPRAMNCLESENIVTIGDLVRRTEEDLLKIHNLGQTTLDDIKQRLAEAGLSLGMEVPENVGKVGAP